MVKLIFKLNCYIIMGLDKILDSKTKIKILKILIENPDRDFYITELSKMINVTQSAVSQQIIYLVKENLTEEKKRGKMKFYKIINNEKTKAIKSLINSWKE